jgi:hypothetical protein
MSRIRLQFELSDKQQQEQIVEDLQKQFSSLEIGLVRVRPERPRLTGVEIVALIGVGIVVTRASRALIEELFETAKLVVRKYREIKDVSVGVGQAQVPVSQVTDEQIQQMVEEAAGHQPGQEGDSSFGTTVQ